MFQGSIFELAVAKNSVIFSSYFLNIYPFGNTLHTKQVKTWNFFLLQESLDNKSAFLFRSEESETKNTWKESCTVASLSNDEFLRAAFSCTRFKKEKL